MVYLYCIKTYTDKAIKGQVPGSVIIDALGNFRIAVTELINKM